MADWMSRYSLRERIIVLVAAVVLIGLSTHALLIEPYQHRYAQVQDELAQGKADLQWMHSVIHQLPNKHSAAQTDSFSGSLANLINQTVNQQKLSSFLSQMTPRGETEISVRFATVPFDKLIQFIAKMSDMGLKVKDLRINAADNPAQVDSSLVLEKG